jgi:hypothetical protein
MGPVASAHSNARNPVDPPVAPPAVQDPRLEFPLQVALHLEQLRGGSRLRLEDLTVSGQAGDLELVDE